MSRRMKNGWRYIVTKIAHPCHRCGQEIPAGARCASRSYFDGVNKTWYSVHVCPSNSCHLPAEERRALMFPNQSGQENISF